MLGPVDLLVNNAAITTYGPLAASPMDEWWRVLEVNVRGPYLCSRVVLPAMLERRTGRIVNVASGAGGVPSGDGQSAYHVSKAAIFRLTECLAAEVDRSGVRAFGLSPGLLETDMGREAERRRGRVGGSEWVSMSRAAAIVEAIAQGRLDTLSGRVLDARDGLSAICDRIDEIVERDLYQLRVRSLAAS
jgi:3-oxoacyl-[acyl-carrier protein] reductase